MNLIHNVYKVFFVYSQIAFVYIICVIYFIDFSEYQHEILDILIFIFQIIEPEEQYYALYLVIF